MSESRIGRPALGATRAAAIARAHWELEPTDVVELASERDRNFSIRDAASGQRYVLKVHNGAEQPGAIDLSNALLERVHERAPELACPRVVATRHGQPFAPWCPPDGPEHAARLFTWVPGVPLADVPKDDGLLADLGRSLGRLARALDGFEHAAAPQDFAWDLCRAPATVGERLDTVADSAVRARIERAIDAFARLVEPRLADLPTGFIHGDANDHNVLVGPMSDEALRSGGRRIEGLIDFGDAVRAPLVFDVAIAAAYAAFCAADPIGAICALVRGRHGEMPLAEDELDVLLPAIRARLAVSVTMSAHARRRVDADEYHSVSDVPARAALEALEAEHPRLALARFRDACGLEPCAASERVRAWVAEHAREVRPVLGEELADARATTVDLSVGTSPWMGPYDPSQAERASEDVRRMMSDAGAGVGVGRWNEPRIAYSTEQFGGGSDAPGARRTVHLGVDLFAPAGTGVFAPLAGTVVSVAVNPLPLDYGPTVILEHAPEPGVRFWTLYGHLAAGSVEHLSAGRSVAAGERIAAFGDERENGGWPPHLHFQLVADLLDREGDYPGVAAPDQRAVWTSLCPDPGPLTPWPELSRSPAPPTDEELLRRRRAHLGPSLSVSYRRPLHVVRGWMQHLYDAEGRAYLDGVNNVAHVGHEHPRVVEALRRQAGILNTNSRYLHEALPAYAERLAATLPDPLSVVFLVCTGSEANELALRLARAHTGRSGVVAVEGGYHGHTQALIDVSSYKHAGPGGSGAPPWVSTAPMPDVYRGAFRVGPDLDAGRCAERYADAVRELCAGRPDGGEAPGAFIAEALPGCGGQIVPPGGWLRRSFEHARAAGAVCIADEVQTGFGRVGSSFWAFELDGAVPDVVTLGKPIGNGHPLAAVVTTPEIAASFANGMEYFNTFGGNPVSCAVGHAVLDVIEEERLQARALEVGGALRAGLDALADRHDLVGDVRGVGLYAGVELVLDRESRAPAPLQAEWVVERARDAGVLLSTDGPDHNVIKLKPPLAFTADDAERTVRVLDRALDALGPAPG